MEEKLVELETKFSYQEDLLSALNEVVIRQQRQLDELLRQMSAVKEQLQEAIERVPGEGGELDQNEKPPHY
ncbi:SlyX family protein [Gammaproteobacteria bacterium]|jgi:SlyX protein|nr:SlyX family protein [Pseudomonadales bacterium]MBT5717940.1 SlyX family protein [Gammaproteobacteria bacterium]MBT7225859.1 SlyX family protein [Gammaproteobacteria bacterium]MDB3898770.1 SlyX family protein [Gammaproteobacteria bacterium]